MLQSLQWTLGSTRHCHYGQWKSVAATWSKCRHAYPRDYPVIIGWSLLYILLQEGKTIKPAVLVEERTMRFDANWKSNHSGKDWFPNFLALESNLTRPHNVGLWKHLYILLDGYLWNGLNKMGLCAAKKHRGSFWRVYQVVNSMRRCLTGGHGHAVFQVPERCRGSEYGGAKGTSNLG